MKLQKYEGNPILAANEACGWESLCVLNPGVIYDDENNEFIMLYRAAGNDKAHVIRFGLAKSKDGVHFARVSGKPCFDVHPEDADGGCVEDPRIVKIDGVYYIVYAARAFSPGQYWIEGNIDIVGYNMEKQPESAPHFIRTNRTVSYLASTRDFKTFKRLGRITDPRYDDRDVLIFPEKVNGKFVRISRPKFKDGRVKMPSVWISYGDDLLCYEEPELLITGQEEWETERIGAACPPLKTDKGWFLLYHGVSGKDHHYRIGAILMDLKDPKKVIARTKDFMMEPDEEYERNGIGNPCVFPTGNVVKDGKLYIYYGCCDKHIGLATADFKEIIDYLWNCCRI